MILIDSLNSIRRAETEASIKQKVLYTLAVFVFGILLGMFSKWLDILSLNSSVWWMKIIEQIDLGNFFSGMSVWLFIALTISIYSKSPFRAAVNVFFFFVGMCGSYHLYTIIFSKFNPQSYMMIWYMVTLASPALAFICWFAKSENPVAIMLDSVILFVLCASCFSIGQWYIGLKSTLELLVFIGSCIVIYKKPQVFFPSIIIGFILAFLIQVPYLNG